MHFTSVPHMPLHFPPVISDIFVLLVQAQAALEVASKKKLPDIPSVPKNASAGNNDKAG
jgi:hypothetical protein